MNYWINLFTWNTWQEFLEAGANISGFRKRRWATVQKMSPGDQLLCYMTGISRFFAVLEVTGEPYLSEDRIWGEDVFPCRIPVKVVLSLEPQYAVPVQELAESLSYFRDSKSENAWTGHFRSSPTEEKPEDARVIIDALYEAQRHPVAREFDIRKLERKVYETSAGTVSIPENDETEIAGVQELAVQPEGPTHEEIQWLLLWLGQEMKLDIWVARNDRGRTFEGQAFASLPRLLNSLPVQFNQATTRTIELIDVLWLQGNTIIAAFEIEHTSAVYSGLLRMADLITMQPNLKLPLFIVAPDEREEKVRSEINRPVFNALKQPLPKICRYIPYSILRERVEQAHQTRFSKYLQPEFLDEIAENVELEEL